MPDIKFLFKNFSHLLALGFGAGISKIAPGTIGTLAAIPFFSLIKLMPDFLSYFFVLTLFFIGIHVSNETSRALKIKDPSCIVIDEIVGFLFLLLLIKQTLFHFILAFFLFRLFDITKPFPIKKIEMKIKGGLGIMLDDIAAAIYALIVIGLIDYVI